MKLELLFKETCPYSAKVRAFIAENGLEAKIDERDIESDPENLEELRDLTGDEQVPCLVVDGKPMLESDDIIAFLKKIDG